jgi:hypothetical protein
VGAWLLLGAWVSEAWAATIAYAPDDFSSALTLTHGSQTYSGKEYRDHSNARDRVDTNLPYDGEVQTVWHFYDKSRIYTYDSLFNSCSEVSSPEVMSANVTDDSGNDVTNFVQDGTLVAGGQTLQRWVGSSGGHSIVVGLGQPPGALPGTNTVVVRSSPAGTVQYTGSFTSGQPDASVFNLPEECVGAGPPAAIIDTPAGGAIYAVHQSVSAGYTCQGNGAALKPGDAGCSGPVADGSPIATDTPGAHSFTVTATQTDSQTWTATRHYTVAAAPTASIMTPANGATYTPGQVVNSTFGCSEGASGPGIATCQDQDGSGSGAAVDTSTTGPHTYTVTATSRDGQTRTADVTYDVAVPPSASISAPANGATYAQGAVVESSFSCTDGSGGTGIASCLDQAGHASGQPIDSSMPGVHTLNVTATSSDGLTSANSITYTIAAAPSASISSPVSGRRFTYGQKVLARFSCSEGSDGPGIASCTGSSANGAAIDTSTAGTHTFTVTATSADGQSTTTRATYTVLAPSNRLVTPPRWKTFADGTFIVTIRVPGPGVVNIMETAWDDNLATVAVLLRPAPRRFVFARAHAVARRAGMLRIIVTPNARGRALVAHHTYRVTLRLWISYAPTGGRQRNIGYYDLHLR